MAREQVVAARGLHAAERVRSLGVGRDLDRVALRVVAREELDRDRLAHLSVERERHLGARDRRAVRIDDATDERVALAGLVDRVDHRVRVDRRRGLARGLARGGQLGVGGRFGRRRGLGDGSGGVAFAAARVQADQERHDRGEHEDEDEQGFHGVSRFRVEMRGRRPRV